MFLAYWQKYCRHEKLIAPVRGCLKKWNCWECKMGEAFVDKLTLTGEETFLPFSSWEESINNPDTARVDFGWGEGVLVSIPKKSREQEGIWEVNRLLWTCGAVQDCSDWDNPWEKKTVQSQCEGIHRTPVLLKIIGIAVRLLDVSLLETCSVVFKMSSFKW